ncbi:hypothetical protein, partial [Calothrix rhizosoleniae]|uniref:hypothetical protein n=1 Tax=Calothrix rhizosoleniae TaxID=888997 RepID=UPI000B498847
IKRKTAKLSSAVLSRLFACEQQQLTTLDFWEIRSRKSRQSAVGLREQVFSSLGDGCNDSWYYGLGRTLVSLLLFSAAFSIQSVSAQSSSRTVANSTKKQIGQSAIAKSDISLYSRLQQSQLGSIKKLKLNPDSRHNREEIFGYGVLADGVQSSHGWFLAEVKDSTDIFPEFLPIPERIITTGLDGSDKQKNEPKSNAFQVAVERNNPSKLSALEEKVSANRSLLTESLKSDKFQKKIKEISDASDNFNQRVNQGKAPEKYGEAESIGVVELVPQQQIDFQLAQQDSATPETENQELDDIDDILEQLEAIPKQQSLPFPAVSNAARLSPAFTISNPSGYGADNFTAFISASYQRRTRFTRTSDGEMGFGIGLGNAVKAVGVELAYTLNTFGTSQGFGSGSFSIKVHRRIAEDMAVAIGWNQFADILIGDVIVPFDYPDNSYYAVVTKIFNIQKYIDAPFSRVAVTAGIGSGQFLDFDRITEAVINDEAPTGLGVFGSLGVRVVQPISVIIEWSGQDLGIGLSIVPFKNIPVVITPAIRDISGAGDGARFIMGTGISIKL